MTDSNEQPKRKFGGKQPGAGRKSRAVEFGLAELMNEAWPVEKRKEAIEHIASLILTARSDKTKVEAFNSLMAYCYGKPKETKEISGVEGNAIEIRDVTELSTEELTKIIEG